MKSQFLGKSELEMELFDAVLRRFKQFDDHLYVNEGPLRWRHYVECDFMVCQLFVIPLMLFNFRVPLCFLYNQTYRVISLHFSHDTFFLLQVSLLAGSFDLADPTVSSLFYGPHISYDVTSCKIVSL